MIDAYKVLGVGVNAGEQTIKAAFRRAVKRCHPDLNGGGLMAQWRFRRLIAARDALIGRRQRSSFACTGRPQLRPPARIKAFAVASGVMFAGSGMIMAALLIVSSFELPQPAYAFAGTPVLENPHYALAATEGLPSIRYADRASIAAIRHPLDASGSNPDTAPGEGAASQLPQAGARLTGFQWAVSRAASRMSRTWRRLAGSGKEPERL